MRRAPRRPPIWTALTALSMGVLACSLSFGVDDGGTAALTPDAGPVDRSVPTVRILEPASGSTVPRGQPASITVESDTTATRFQLNVGGLVAGTKSLPAGQSGPTQAILSWLPEREGTFDLQVVAFNGPVASVPAGLQLVVSGTATGTTPATGTCTGRVLVSQLNFRSGPGTNASRLGQFQVGETVQVVGRNATTGWYQIQRADGQSGWVINNGQWFQVEGACAGLAVTG